MSGLWRQGGKETILFLRVINCTFPRQQEDERSACGPAVSIRAHMTVEPYWAALFATPILTKYALLRAQTARAKRRYGATVFHSIFASLYAFIFVFGVFSVTAGIYEKLGALFVLAGAAFCLLSLWQWPATIVLDATGITSKHLWRPSRHIAYSEIECVSRQAGGETVVYGKGNIPEICLTQYHAGADELVSQLRKRGVSAYV